MISPKSFTWTTSKQSANLPNFRFKYASPQHRYYLAREVVSYRCAGAGLDPAGTGQGKLWRDSSANLDGSSASQALLVDGLSSCAFDYAVATNTRSGLVTLRLTLAEAGETITLLQQVHVANAPRIKTTRLWPGRGDVRDHHHYGGDYRHGPPGRNPERHQ